MQCSFKEANERNVKLDWESKCYVTQRVHTRMELFLSLLKFHCTGCQLKAFLVTNNTLNDWI